MCIELFVNHALLFVSNCTVANLSNVSESFDMTHVYDTFTTVAPFITETTLAPNISNVTNVTHNATYDTDETQTFVKPTYPIYGPYLYSAIISPVFALAFIWCITAYARAHCTPCKPKKPTEEKPKEEPKPTEEPEACCTCCKPKKVKPIRRNKYINPV